MSILICIVLLGTFIFTFFDITMKGIYLFFYLVIPEYVIMSVIVIYMKGRKEYIKLFWKEPLKEHYEIINDVCRRPRNVATIKNIKKKEDNKPW